MNKELFIELKSLMYKKTEYENILRELKGKTYYNKICLCKSLYEFYFEDDLIPILINYYEEKIKVVNEKISKFKLSKLID